jgi:two-component system chemotaxis response regulator CheB
MIKVIVIDDSRFTCRVMTSYLQSCPEMEVIATALNGKDGINLVKTLKPDVVTLDLEMPDISGLEVLKHIMYECPIPIVVVSGVSSRGADTTVKAINFGAIDFILKYSPNTDIKPEILKQEIISKVRLASQIKVIRSLYDESTDKIPKHVGKAILKKEPLQEKLTPASVVVIGASTGGPLALRELLSVLPVDFPSAVIIVQHMLKGFTKALAEQLNRQVAIRVKEAEESDRLEPATAYIAPSDHHLLLRADLRLTLGDGPLVKGFRPSIDVTMQSVVQIYGYKTSAVILTGMGDDGIKGMFAIKAKGGKTFAQNPESCVVNTMPRQAKEQGLADQVGTPERIGHLLALAQFRTK